MNQIIRFTPKRELDAQQNLNNFIVLARDRLTLWSELEGFSWDAVKWPTTYRSVRFTKLEHSKLHHSALVQPNQIMHPVFAEFAKAYLRYKHTLRPSKLIAREMRALRIMEFALRKSMTVPNISKFEQRHWDTAVSTLESSPARQYICAAMLDILKTLADFLILSNDPRFWKHPYVGRYGYAATNGTRAPDEVKAKKIPNQDALLAIGEVFSRGASDTQEDVDVMVTSITGLLMSAPMRISETLRFRTECLREDYDKNGELQHYLVYWVPKTQQFTRKAIPKTMIEVTVEAIKRLRSITEEGRNLARHLETNSENFYRHQNCPNVPDDQKLTPIQVMQALGYSSLNGCACFMKRHTDSYALRGFTLDTLWPLVLAENRALNPNFPYQEALDSSSQPPLKMSNSLMCIRHSQLSTRAGTSPVLLTPFNSGSYSKRLSVGSPKQESMNFFARNGYEMFKLNSHSIRHLLNRLGRISGVTMDMLTEWSSRATTRQTRTYLHDDPDKAAAKGAILFGTIQEQEPHRPVTSEELEIYNQGPHHRSRYGICRRSWRAGPCNKFADCLNCSELLMCKGDKIAVETIEQDRDNLIKTYSAAKLAIANGERAASRWTEKAAPQIERLNQLLAILQNPEIPDGSPVEIAGVDFSHEKVIVSEKAKAAGVQLLDRNKLGITYSKELLACLDILRARNDA